MDHITWGYLQALSWPTKVQWSEPNRVQKASNLQNADSTFFELIWFSPGKCEWFNPYTRWTEIRSQGKNKYEKKGSTRILHLSEIFILHIPYSRKKSNDLFSIGSCWMFFRQKVCSRTHISLVLRLTSKSRSSCFGVEPLVVQTLNRRSSHLKSVWVPSLTDFGSSVLLFRGWTTSGSNPKQAVLRIRVSLRRNILWTSFGGTIILDLSEIFILHIPYSRKKSNDLFSIGSIGSFFDKRYVPEFIFPQSWCS